MQVRKKFYNKYAKKYKISVFQEDSLWKYVVNYNGEVVATGTAPTPHSALMRAEWAVYKHAVKAGVKLP